MKQVLASTLLALTSLSAHAVVGRVRPMDLERAQLINFEGVNHQFGGKILSGKIAVTRDQNLVLTLEIQPDANDLGSGPFRRTAEPYTTQVKLPIVSEEQNDVCGGRVITARADARPVDGALEELVLNDYRNELCDIYRPYAATVTYSTTTAGFGGPVQATVSDFGADRISPVYYPMGAVR